MLPNNLQPNPQLYRREAVFGPRFAALAAEFAANLGNTEATNVAFWNVMNRLVKLITNSRTYSNYQYAIELVDDLRARHPSRDPGLIAAFECLQACAAITFEPLKAWHHLSHSIARIRAAYPQGNVSALPIQVLIDVYLMQNNTLKALPLIDSLLQYAGANVDSRDSILNQKILALLALGWTYEAKQAAEQISGPIPKAVALGWLYKSDPTHNHVQLSNVCAAITAANEPRDALPTLLKALFFKPDGVMELDQLDLNCLLGNRHRAFFFKNNPLVPPQLAIHLPGNLITTSYFHFYLVCLALDAYGRNDQNWENHIQTFITTLSDNPSRRTYDNYALIYAVYAHCKRPARARDFAEAAASILTVNNVPHQFDHARGKLTLAPEQPLPPTPVLTPEPALEQASGANVKAEAPQTPPHQVGIKRPLEEEEDPTTPYYGQQPTAAESAAAGERRARFDTDGPSPNPKSIMSLPKGAGERKSL